MTQEVEMSPGLIKALMKPLIRNRLSELNDILINPPKDRVLQRKSLEAERGNYYRILKLVDKKLLGVFK